MDAIAQTSQALTTNEALVLQQVYDDVEADITLLSSQLGMRRTTVIAALVELQRKRLVTIHRKYADMWIDVSSKGKKLIGYIWPEQPRYAL